MSRLVRYLLSSSLLLLLTVSSLAQAENKHVITGIHDIWNDQPHVQQVLSLSDGRIYLVKSDQEEVMETVERAYAENRSVMLTLDDDQDHIIGVKILDENQSDEMTFFEEFSGLDLESTNELERVFRATNLSSGAQASQLFRGLPMGRSNTQCFDRAHYWAYDMWRKSGINSQKIFLFFTKRYIRDFNYRWWFHVAPYVLVNHTPYVVDRQFTSRPLTERTWTNLFMANDAGCPNINHYYDYYYHQEREYCYVRKMPMYYYHPNDVRQHDERGMVMSNWIGWQLRRAAQAF